MMGTMLQDELNAITVGIFLQVESGYMTWLNYRLLDTLWSCGSACGGAAPALWCTCNTYGHHSLRNSAWCQCRFLKAALVLEKHRLKTRQTTTEEHQSSATGGVWSGFWPGPCCLVIIPPFLGNTCYSLKDKVDKEQAVVFSVVLFSTWVPLIKLISQQEYRPTCLTPAGHL